MHRSVAVVPGPFSVELAAALAGVSRERAEELLSWLVHRSMLTSLGPRRPGRPSRFAQLNPIRAHALGLLPDDELFNLQASRDRWVQELVGGLPELGSRRQLVEFARVEDDLSALRATLQHRLVEHPDRSGSFIVGRLPLFWYFHGMLVEWERWAALAQASEQGTPADRLMSQISRIGALAFMGRTDPEILDLQRAIDDLGRDEALEVAPLLFATSYALRGARDVEAAQRVASLGRSIATRFQSAHLDLLDEAARACVRPLEDAPAAILADSDDAYRRALAMDNPFVTHTVAISAAGAALRGGDIRTGLVWSDRSLAVQVPLGLGGSNHLLETRGSLMSAAGRFVEAVEILAASRARARRGGWHWPVFPTTPAVLADALGHLSPEEGDAAERRGEALSLEQIVASTIGPAAVDQDPRVETAPTEW
jgi:hypothetical protein